jgi:hypothetical protein
MHADTSAGSDEHVFIVQGALNLRQAVIGLRGGGITSAGVFMESAS